MTITAQDQQRIEQDYYLPITRKANYYVNGVFKCEGEIRLSNCGVENRMRSELFAFLAKRWNCSPSDITIDY